MKVFNYIMLLSGFIVLLEIAGIPTGADGVRTLIGFATGQVDITASNFFDAIFSADLGILLIGLAGSIVTGFVLRGRLENFIILPFITGTLIFFAQVFQSIITEALKSGQTWESWIILLILTPLTVGYIFSLVEFFRGAD